MPGERQAARILYELHPSRPAGGGQGRDESGRIDDGLAVELETDRLLTPVAGDEILDPVAVAPGRAHTGPRPARQLLPRVTGQLATQMDAATEAVARIDTRLHEQLAGDGAVGFSALA